MPLATLKDGRKLAYEDYGDANGRPVLLLHGTPGSRLWSSGSFDDAGSNGIRIITNERPGYGLTDPSLKASLEGFMNDLKELLGILQLDKFSVVSVSGGSPFALACAYYLPKRLQNVYIVAGIAPPEASKEGMDINNRIGFWLLKHARPVYRYLANQSRNLVIQHPEKYLKYIRHSLPEEDVRLLEDPQVVTDLILHLTEAYRNGIKGIEYDSTIISNSWGFELKDIKVKVKLWHGRNDTLSPCSMAQFMSSGISDSELRIFENAGHLILDDKVKWKMLLDEL